MATVTVSPKIQVFISKSIRDRFTSAVKDTSNLIIFIINICEVFKEVLLEKDESAALQVIAIMQQAGVEDVNAQLSLT